MSGSVRMWTVAMALSTSFCLWASSVEAQEEARGPAKQRFFVGSSLFVLANFVPDDNKPDFVQLNFGYRITPKDVVSVELKTWKYAWPLGIPYGDSFEAPDERYPGHVRDVGIAVAYQRFLWKGAYAAVHAMQARQAYADEAGDRIQTGYQLFMTYRLGHHLPVFRGALFIEPSVAATHWPIRTNVPESFARKDREWPNYFLFEPGLHFGVRF